jgi:hypothetical protein
LTIFKEPIKEDTRLSSTIFYYIFIHINKKG